MLFWKVLAVTTRGRARTKRGRALGSTDDRKHHNVFGISVHAIHKYTWRCRPVYTPVTCPKHRKSVIIDNTAGILATRVCSWRTRGSKLARIITPAVHLPLFLAPCVFGFHFLGSSTSHCSPAASSNSGSASHAHSTAPPGSTFSLLRPAAALVSEPIRHPHDAPAAPDQVRLARALHEPLPSRSGISLKPRAYGCTSEEVQLSGLSVLGHAPTPGCDDASGIL